jgi:hypothetical protein
LFVKNTCSISSRVLIEFRLVPVQSQVYCLDPDPTLFRRQDPEIYKLPLNWLQVRWDCPPEYVEYQAAPPTAAPPSAAPPTATTGLVSGYDTESDNEEEEEQEVMDVEKKPDFIGPRIPEVLPYIP